MPIPPNFNYHQIEALSKESREQLSKIRPVSIGQASQVGGVTPADISVLLTVLEVHKRQALVAAI